MSIMETATCNCAGCGNLVGQFVNLWNQIGKTYFSPVVDSEHTPSVTPTGPVRTGTPGTLVEGCELQDQACSGCGALLGIRCLGAPVNHVLHENQLMLNLAASVAVSGEDGKRLEANVTRRFKLQMPSTGIPGRSPSPDPVAPEQVLLQLETQGRAIDLIHKAGSNSIFRLDEKLDGFSRDLGSMRRDFSGSQTHLASLAGQVQRMSEMSNDKKSLDQLRKQIDSVRAVAEDGTALEELKKELDVVKLSHSHLETQIRTVNSQIAEAQRKTVASVSKLQREMSSSFKKALSELREEIAQQQLEMMEANRERPDEISALRDEIARYRKDAEQTHAKELSKLRSELTKRQKVAVLTLDGQISAIRGDIASKESEVDERLAKLSTACREGSELRGERETGLQEALRSLKTEHLRHKRQLDAVEEQSLRREDHDQLREQLSGLQDDLASLPRQFAVLKGRIAEIGNRADQVDNLKMDVEFLQLRVAGTGRQGPETNPSHDPQTAGPGDNQSGSDAKKARPPPTKAPSRDLKRRRSAPAPDAMSDLDELAEEETSPVPFSKRKPAAFAPRHSTATGWHVDQVSGHEGGDAPPRPKDPLYSRKLRPRRAARSRRRATASLDNLAEFFGD